MGRTSPKTRKSLGYTETQKEERAGSGS